MKMKPICITSIAQGIFKFSIKTGGGGGGKYNSSRLLKRNNNYFLQLPGIKMQKFSSKLRIARIEYNKVGGVITIGFRRKGE